MIVKVCGMRYAANIRAVEALGIDLMGFIFWPKSRRHVSERPEYLPTRCRRVGVFVDAEAEEVRRISSEYALDYIQLHGHEDAEYCKRLQGYHLIKAFNIGCAADLSKTEEYAGLVDCFLFDTKGQSVGGNGEKFDWSLLDHYTGNTPFLLSGGIGPSDAPQVKSMKHPQCIGIDLNSRFETSPGMKDINHLKTFIETL